MMPSQILANEPRSSTAASFSSTSSSIHHHALLSEEPTPEYKHKTNLPWILHHILECELSSELPLRIMFSFNAGHRLPKLTEAHKWWKHEPRGRLIIEFLSNLEKSQPPTKDASLEKVGNSVYGPPETLDIDNAPGDRFANDPGNDSLFDLSWLAAKSPTIDRRLSQGMPKGFVKNFCLNKVFSEDYNEVDFKQALTGIDYLRDLECTRRVSLREAAQRLNIRQDNWKEVLHEEPMAKWWVEMVQTAELEIEQFYAGIYLDLRIWTMINELQIEPFYRTDIVAMLNTLFPPSVRELPNDRISHKVLQRYRSTFYRYIDAVEKNGPAVLDSFIVKLGQPGSKHSWLGTRSALEQYLERADAMVEQAISVTGLEFFHGEDVPESPEPSEHYRSGSMTSSNFSGRPLTGSSANSSLDGNGSYPTTPRTPNFPINSSTVRSKIYSRRKLSAPSDAQDFFEPEGSVTPVGILDHPETSDPAVKDFANFKDGAVYSESPLQRLGTNESSSSRPRSHSKSAATFAEEDQRLSATRSNTASLGPPAAGSIHRRSTSLGRPRTAMEYRSALAVTPERTGPVIPPTPVLPTGNLDFLSRPYEENPAVPSPLLKKQRSFGSLFQRKKPVTSIAALANLADQEEDAKKKGRGLGISMLSTKSTETLSYTNGSLSKSTSDFPNFENDAGSERALLRKKKSCATDVTKQTPAMSNGRVPNTPGTEIKRRKGLADILIKRPSYSDTVFIETGDERERYIAQIPETPRLIPSLKKQRSTPNLVPGGRNRLRKASSSSKLQKTIITSGDIQNPLPSDLRNKVSSKPRRPSEGRLAEDGEEFGTREYGRTWLLEDARAEKFGLQKPPGTPVLDKSQIQSRGGGGGLGINLPEFAPQQFENPRAAPTPLKPVSVRRGTGESTISGRTLTPGTPSIFSGYTPSIAGQSTPTIKEIDEKLRREKEAKSRRARAGTHTPVTDVSRFVLDGR